MDELVEFLRARLDEDERVAQAAGGAWVDGPAANWVTAVPVGESSGPVHRVALAITGGERDHIVRHDPARVLAEVDAKRRLLAEHELVPAGQGGELGCDICVATPSWGPEVVSGPCTTLRLLALPFADHPDYREAWRP
ncbi:DUF6221 family protein [Streptomyces sp. F-1]|uniref:DUF6221 family protein n=1 Tax=Streptomyces sp. F-1 TaxID=463642 RepID=UPI00085C06A4|nr:DUF6221 family protein [Streptomyces sp. F-1]SFY52079.1 hypothetical protein STEPF1_05348 [Streptomyces sp. F-1]